MKNYLVVISLVLLGCNQDPIAVSSSNNPNVKVDELFTHKGCTVYRFLDGRYHYFTDCIRATTITTHSEACGKGCVNVYDTNIEAQ